MGQVYFNLKKNIWIFHWNQGKIQRIPVVFTPNQLLNVRITFLYQDIFSWNIMLSHNEKTYIVCNIFFILFQVKYSNEWNILTRISHLLKYHGTNFYLWQPTVLFLPNKPVCACCILYMSITEIVSMY